MFPTSLENFNHIFPHFCSTMFGRFKRHERGENDNSRQGLTFFNGVLLTVGEVGFQSYPKKKTWKEGKTNALHVPNTCLMICLLILTSFEGIFGRLSQCNDMFLVGLFKPLFFGAVPHVTDWELESSLII